MIKWVEILSIIRIKNVIIAFLCSIITLHKIKFNIIAYDSIVSILIVLLLIIGSNIINDFYDIRTDKINRPDRLLVKNATLKRPLIIIALFMCICSLLLAFTLNINSLLSRSNSLSSFISDRLNTLSYIFCLRS